MNPILLRLQRDQRLGLALGVGFLGLWGLGAWLSPHDAMVGWLCAFIFWIGLTLGCFYAAMVHYLTAGRWGSLTRRFFEAGYMTLPLMAGLFLPILLGLHQLYPWARPDAVAADKILQHKAAYENPAGFTIRAGVAFALWLGLAVRLRNWSRQQDQSASLLPTVWMRTCSGPGIALVPLVVTFALVDWVMSIEAAWFSTIFAVILMAGQMLVAVAFAILLLARFRREAPFAALVTEEHFHDLGNLLLAFVMFWTYVAFSQFLIIYSGNQPHEIGWYLRRIAGGWKWLVCGLAAVHFLLPFLLLLFRTVKKDATWLAPVAAGLFLVHAVEIYWAVAPTFYPGWKMPGMALAAWLGIGGLWLAVFAGNLRRHPLLAQNDPRLEPLIAEAANAR